MRRSQTELFGLTGGSWRYGRSAHSFIILATCGSALCAWRVVFRRTRLTDEDLQKRCKTPDDAPITTWKWLRLMVEHEIHHRGQVYIYLSLLGVATPPLYGLTSEEVRSRAAVD
jgi:hypothetical protein